MVVGDRSCVINGRTYLFHLITLPGVEGSDDQAISCLLDPDILPLLPDPIPSACPPIENPNHCVKWTDERGYGLFAARDIPAGDLIAVEHPAVILPSGDFPPEIYNELADRLPTKRRGEFLAMANCRPKEECASHAEGVVRTNALMLELDPKAKQPQAKRLVYGGAYPLINRANHSCGPNAAVKWSHSALTLSLYALRPIRAGEEIQKTYLEPALPRQQRIAHLEKNYRFTCDCPWCNIRGTTTTTTTNNNNTSSTPFTPTELALIAASDARREQLSTWIFTHPGYKKWSTDLTRADDVVIAGHLAALALIEPEGLHGLQNLFVEEIALCYAMLGELDAFRAWGARVVQLTQVEDPPVSERFREWLVDPPRRVKKWGWRKKQREQIPKRRKASESEAVEDDIPMDDIQFLF